MQREFEIIPAVIIYRRNEEITGNFKKNKYSQKLALQGVKTVKTEEEFFSRILIFLIINRFVISKHDLVEDTHLQKVLFNVG